MPIPPQSNLNQEGHFRTIVCDLFSERIRANFPDLVKFTEYLLLYLEQEHEAGGHLNTLRRNRDIDRIPDTLLTQLQKEVGNAFPRSISADPRIFSSRIVDFYKSRGTPDSIKAFFRYLYNDEVEIYFPREDLLIPSDGRYFDSGAIDNRQPSFTFTISGNNVDTISGTDDLNRDFSDLDNPIIRQTVGNNVVIRTDWTAVINTRTGAYSIDFDQPLPNGAVIDIFYSGIYTTNDGYLSDSKRIHDSNYYQLYSYVLRTGTAAEIWRNPFSRLSHPAGFKFFGEIQFITFIDYMLDFLQPGQQTSGLSDLLGITDTKLLTEREFWLCVDINLEDPLELTIEANYHHGVQSQFFDQTPSFYYDDYTIEQLISGQILTHAFATEVESISFIRF